MAATTLSGDISRFLRCCCLTGRLVLGREAMGFPEIFNTSSLEYMHVNIYNSITHNRVKLTLDTSETDLQADS